MAIFLARSPVEKETKQEILVQSTSWRRNAQGIIELVADTSANVQQVLTCAVSNVS